LNRNRAIQAFAIVLTLAVMVGCQATVHQENNPEAVEAGAASGPESLITSVTSQRAAAEAPAAPRTITVPAGTPIDVRISTEINSGSTVVGSTFDGVLAEPLVVEGVTVAPRGSLIAGRVANKVSSGGLKQRGEISLVLTSITPSGGQQTSVSTQAWTVSDKSHQAHNIAMISGGAGAGASATGKTEIGLPAETEMTFDLAAPARFSVEE
jgi:hypothetical protein